MEEYKRYIAGGLSGMVEVLLTHPLDYLKTKKQEYIQKGISNNFYENIIREKNFNLYKGVIPRMLGVIPMRLTFWGVQDATKHHLRRNDIIGVKAHVLTGIIGGSCQTVIDNPIEIIKIKIMSDKKVNHKDLYRNYGFIPTLIRNVGFTACLAVFIGQKADSDFEKFGLSATGGAIGSILTQPLDYVKTKSQSTKQNLSVIKEIKIAIKENPRKLYVGGVNRMMVSFLSMGIGFVAYSKFYNLICG